MQAPFPLDTKQVTKNHWLAVLNGMFIELGMTLANPGMVLPVLVRQLGGSNALIGLLPTIRFGGWFLPQFVIGQWVQSRRRKVPIVVAIDLIRIALYAAIGAILFTLGARMPALALTLVLLLFTITRFSAGSAAVARMDLYGALVPRHKRAALIASKGFWGGLAGFGAGFAVGYVLNEQHIPFPQNFALLFTVAAGCFATASFLMSRTREPPRDTTPSDSNLKQLLKRAGVLLKRDAQYRRYIMMRVLIGMIRIAGPFYIIYAIDVLHAPASIAGAYLSMLTFARILSTPLWSRVLDRRGHKFVLQFASVLLASSTLLAVLIPALIRPLALPDTVTGIAFGLVLIVQGLASGGHNVSLLPTLYEIAPAKERASYIGLLNTILGPTSFVSTLSGALIDRVGFSPMFLTAGALVMGGFLIGCGLQIERNPSKAAQSTPRTGRPAP